MRELPAGTVTFLFTDIEGSTRLLHELGDAYADALADHRRRLREAFTRYGGVEVDTQGDAFFVAFARASDALAAADEGRGALAEGPIRVRMGLHTGEPQLTEEGYVGLDVHKGARIAAAGHGGQILVSQTTRDLADTDGLVDLGEHRLKDLSAPERLYQLGAGEFPPLKTLYQTNLPVPATPFVGRERELAEVAALVGRPDARLVTLTGAGGTGKTRLALQAAGATADAYPHGVWWVPLASVADDADVPGAVVRALGGSGSVEDTLADRRLLLLLDNFEHVIGAAAAIAEAVAASPNADVLVTSRERLRLAGEHVYPVPVLARADAQALFVGRARALDPSFAPDDAVDEICERLDDLPLALELAAARTGLLTSQQLLERLGGRLDLLKGGRDAEHRQATLRATIEWSYDLLAADEQELFGSLGVFHGGWTLDAAETVCGADIDDLQSLVDKSLIRVAEGRFWMLETIRDFAVERLDERPDREELRRRHAERFLAHAESAHLSIDTIEAGRQRHDLAIADRANLIAGIEWALAAGEIDLAARTAVALENYWLTNDPPTGRRLFEAVLEHEPALPAETLPRVLRAAGAAADALADRDTSQKLYERALAEYRSLGDARGEGISLQRLAGNAWWGAKDPDLARELIEQSLEIHRRIGFRLGETISLGVLGNVEWGAGERERPLELLEQSVRLAEEIGFTWWDAGTSESIGSKLLELERMDEAELWLQRSLAVYLEIGDRLSVIGCLTLLAQIALRCDDLEHAGRLWGAVERAEEQLSSPLWDQARERYAGPLLTAEGAVFEGARAAGRSLTLEDAVELASATR